MPDQNLVFKSAHEVLREILEARVTVTELTDCLLQRVEEVNPKLNAIVTFDKETVQRQARLADEALKQERAQGKLFGIPITVKDNIEVAGLRATASHKPLMENVPEQDATVVARLRSAGVIILGKTNLPELALDSQTNSPVFGRTNNPWDPERTPGGSTGGGAAAVAAGISFLELGNDFMGSLRIPAHFCGIYGLVPTTGLIPKKGFIPQPPPGGTFGQMLRMGMLSRSVEDLRIGLSVVAGQGPDEPETVPVNWSGVSQEGSTIRIAWTDDLNTPVSEETCRVIRDFAQKLNTHGFIVERVNPDFFDFDLSRRVFLRLFYSVMVTRMQPAVRWLVRVFGSPYLDMNLSKYLAAEAARIRLINDLESFFKRWDVLLCPVTATPAFRHLRPDRYQGPNPIYTKGIEVDGKRVPYATANLAMTIPFSLTGHPVVTVPVGFSNEGLPIGVQVVGRRWNDAGLLDVAARLAKVSGGWRMPQIV